MAQTGGFYGGGPVGGVRPNVGATTRVGDLRPQLERYFDRATLPATAPTWIVTPSLGVDVGVTDNAFKVERPRRADFLTVVEPDLVVSGDMPRLKVDLAYSPRLTIYAINGSETRFDQSGQGRALATVVEDTLFIDLRGSVTRSSLTGTGIDQAETSTFGRDNEVQTITFAATPYVQRRFGGWGTAKLGYSFVRTLQDTQGGRDGVDYGGATAQAFGTPGYGITGNLTTQRERASFASGENLGRFNDLLVAEAIQYSGGGSYSGAHRNQAQNELGFALTRQITLLAGIGYQDLRYAGTPEVRINEPTWNVGGRYAPSPDSVITVLYGRRDGITTASFDGRIAPTARTRLIGRYSAGVTTDIEQAQGLLETTSVGPTGLVTDAATGAPVGFEDSFGVQNGVFESRRLSATGLLLQERDSYSVSVVDERRKTLTNAPGLFADRIVPAGTASESVYVSASWQHELSPDMTSAVSAQYGVTNNGSALGAGGTGRQRTLAASVALTRRFTESLSGSVRYTYTDQSTGGRAELAGAGRRFARSRDAYTENLVLVGLRKSF